MLPDLLDAKRTAGVRVAVCIPAHDEAATLPEVLAVVRQSALVDRIFLADDGSTDATAALAAAAGVTVITAGPPGAPLGKGAAMTALAAAASTADLLVFLDADVRDTTERFISDLLAPLLGDDTIVLVKGFYERPLDGSPTGGGRVTELLARPLLEHFRPSLASIRQPLAGETAVRRSVLEAVALEPGYGVEIGLLLDVESAFGTDAIAQVDLGVRTHRNRPLDELRPQAREILSAVLARSPG